MPRKAKPPEEARDEERPPSPGRSLPPTTKGKGKSPAVAKAVVKDGYGRNVCSQPSVIRYEKDDYSVPMEMWGVPQLDDNGERMYRRCRLPPIRGTDRCKSHGGSMPPSLKTAEELLAQCRDRLMAGLLHIAFDETKDDRLRFDAMRWGLERAGFQAGVTVSLGIKPWQDVLATLKAQMNGETPDDQEG